MKLERTVHSTGDWNPVIFYADQINRRGPGGRENWSTFRTEILISLKIKFSVDNNGK